MRRRRVLAGFTAAAALASAPPVVRAAPLLQAKCGTGTVPATSSIAIRGQEAFKAIEQESNGAVQIQLFTDNALGSGVSQITQLRTGAIQFYFEAGLGLGGIKPLFAIEAVAFMFKNYQEVFKAYDGGLGNRIKSELADAGLIPVGRTFMAGPIHFLNSVRPIRTPDDLQGLKIRITVARPQMEALSALGGSSITISGSEAYTAVQTHVADGISSNLEVLEGQHFYEISKYLSLTSHAWANYFFLANNEMWHGLPDNLKAVITRNISKYATLQRADNEALQKTLTAKLSQQGLVVNTVDPRPFRAKLSQYYQQQKVVFGADVWALVESAVGKLG